MRWYVQNVREVYYENLPMNGKGEHEECIEKANETYTLVTILENGAAQVYTTTVKYLAPTPTVTPTPSFTPVPCHTDLDPGCPRRRRPRCRFVCRGAGPQRQRRCDCAAGQSCEAALLYQWWFRRRQPERRPGCWPFPVLLCRPDGVCGAGSLLFSAVGPGNTAYLVARFTVPEGATAQTATYQFQAYSEGSGRTTFDPIAINLIVP